MLCLYQKFGEKGRNPERLCGSVFVLCLKVSVTNEWKSLVLDGSSSILQLYKKEKEKRGWKNHCSNINMWWWLYWVWWVWVLSRDRERKKEKNLAMSVLLALVLFWVTNFSNFSNTLLEALLFGSFEGSSHHRKLHFHPPSNPKKTDRDRAIDNRVPSASS